MVSTIATEDCFKTDLQSGCFYSVCDLCLFSDTIEEKNLTKRPGNDTNCWRTSNKAQVTWLWPRLLMLLLLAQVSLISLVVVLGMLRKSRRVGSAVGLPWWASLWLQHWIVHYRGGIIVNRPTVSIHPSDTYQPIICITRHYMNILHAIDLMCIKINDPFLFWQAVSCINVRKTY